MTDEQKKRVQELVRKQQLEILINDQKKQITGSNRKNSGSNKNK